MIATLLGKDIDIFILIILITGRISCCPSRLVMLCKVNLLSKKKTLECCTCVNQIIICARLKKTYGNLESYNSKKICVSVVPIILLSSLKQKYKWYYCTSHLKIHKIQCCSPLVVHSDFSNIILTHLSDVLESFLSSSGAQNKTGIYHNPASRANVSDLGPDDPPWFW